MKRFLLLISLMFVSFAYAGSKEKDRNDGYLDRLNDSQLISAAKAVVYGVAGYFAAEHAWHNAWDLFVQKEYNETQGRKFALALTRRSVITISMVWAALWCAKQSVKNAAHALGEKR